MTVDKKMEEVKNGKKIGDSRSPMQDAMREFSRNKIAVGGMLFVLFVLFIAIAAPVFAPYDFAQQNLRNNRAKPMEGYDVVESYAAEKCRIA